MGSTRYAIAQFLVYNTGQRVTATLSAVILEERT
jgi:hypothetical protein